MWNKSFCGQTGRMIAVFAIAIATAFGFLPAVAQTAPALDLTITKSGLEQWASDKCSLRKDPIKAKYRDHPLVGVFIGDWNNGPRVNFLIYKVKGDGSSMGNVKVYYANAPYVWGSKSSNGGCWEKHAAKIEPDGTVTLDVPRNGSKISFTVEGNALTATYRGKGGSLTGTFIKAAN